MYLTIWSINVNSTTESFATHGLGIEEALASYKAYFKKKNPNKAFNVYKIERLTGIEFLNGENEE